jgi:hypothetical protein
MTLSKTDRLVIALLANGERLTARQIAARYRVSNPYDMIYRLRNEGMNIELNTRVNSKGVAVRVYSVHGGNPKSKRKAA